MVNKLDVLDDKRARWVTPTLTRVHHGNASSGGGTQGVTEGGHVISQPVHFSTSVSTTFMISANFLGQQGTAAASS
jgi:hypothetical protein